MDGTSFAQLFLRGEKLGLHLVNDRGQDFILYSKALTAMVKRPETYVRVKHRNRSGKEMVGYHLGEIWGRLDLDDKKFVQITLFLGEIHQNIALNPVSDEPENIVSRYVFTLIKEDFEIYFNAIALMVGQNALFEDLLDDVGVYIDL